MTVKFGPRSLAGQIALLVAVALFVAQAINFALLLNERRGLRVAQVTGPTVARLIDYTERAGNGINPGATIRTRVRLMMANPIDPAHPRRTDVEQAIERELADTVLAGSQVVTGIRALDPHAPFMRRMGPRRAERWLQRGAELQIAVHRPDGQWLVLSSPWPRSERPLIWQLVAQTLVLYIVVLVPLLLGGHRIARPLRELAQAARGFRPGNGGAPLEPRGPSDVRAVTTAFNTLLQRVEAMLEEKDRMLGAIGHDLRTPLAALRVRIESVEDEDDRARMADTIDEMNRTLDDILSLARLGRPSEAPTETDLPALIDAVVEDFRDLGADVSFEETARLTLKLRPSLMRRAVRNLIENAVKYGDGAEVRIVPAAQFVAIEVADHGPGIPPDKLAAVFDPFTRLEGSRNRETGGAGLGLALARAIVRDAGGDIVLANRPAGGLLATIRLPR